MSVLLMGLVWNSTIRDRTHLDVLLYLADRADDDGTNCFPSITRVARFTRCSERTVQRTITELQRDGWLKVIERGGNGAGNTTKFFIDPEKLKGCQDGTLAKWGKRVTIRQRRVTSTTNKGDIDDIPPAPPIGRHINDTSEDTSIPSPAPQSKRAKEKSPDPRHTPFREILNRYWKSKNPLIEMPWGPAEAGALGMVLSGSPDLTAETFTQLLSNRWKSEVNHSDRPSKWLHGVLSYANGPVDRFGKPLLNGGTNGKLPATTKAGRTLNAAERAIANIEGRARAHQDGDEKARRVGTEDAGDVGGRVIDATL